ncbi:MAG: hypothetical protein N2444_09445 [Methylocystis sp.]|nr:hypothetical protein [Methylocystis sp.]
MKKMPVAAGLALALAAGSAIAADLPSMKGPPPAYVPPPPVISWNGLYGGVNIGYGFGASGAQTGGIAYLPPSVWAGNSAVIWNTSANDLNGVIGGCLF